MRSPGGHLSDAEVGRELVAVGVSTAYSAWLSAGRQGVRTKSDLTDVVSVADEAAEAAMVSLLRRHRPRDSVLGEEGTAREGTSGRTWVLDPLDGSWNFTRGSERWCSAAALVVDDEPVLGVVASGTAHRTWVGGVDVPVTEDEQPLPPLADRPLGESQLLTYLHPPHHATEVGQAWRRLAHAVATLRMTGSGSLDATDVAAGRAELSVQHSVPLWDAAPGEALVRAAGGISRRVQAAGVEWFLLGTPRAVTEAERLLVDR
ncbi:inositol monophosphatase family protein [Nocardioides sp. Y6]|uniref:Inositol monophosphatase family protein n=1 Tax=Nocardioides malaquae TaxID=2773426 RepID=A0ABR9RRW0_9ACTN|nr:inositol monophosphatase family protein [Nocardioides malaquae]MBE7324308.1 inositol monophosphatase family protein [Nocardioides malaquae]